MRPIHALRGCVAALALCGCSSTDAAPPSSCGAGQTTGDGTPFCYTLPAGFKPKGDAIQRPGWLAVSFASDDRAQITFIARDLDGFDKTWKALQGNAASSKAADAKEEEFADGKGKILTYTTPEKEPRVVISALRRGARNTLECEAEYKVSAPKPELLEACKSLREP